MENQGFPQRGTNEPCSQTLIVHESNKPVIFLSRSKHHA